MLDKVVIFANEQSKADMLLAGACGHFGHTVVVTSNEAVHGPGKTYRYSVSETLVVSMSSLVDIVKNERPDVVLCESGADGKLFAGCVSAAIGTTPICDAMSVEFKDDGICASRMVYGGGAIADLKSSLPAVVVVSDGAFTCDGKAADCSAADESFTVEPKPSGKICVTGVEEAPRAKTVNLAAAKCVIGVGRGACALENRGLIDELAARMHAEIGCTRPMAEEEHWYGKERYIGVSGCTVKPKLYFALGISGQVQHMVGANRSGLIFAIDKNERASITEQADYTLVGDINKLLPQIMELLQ